MTTEPRVSYESPRPHVVVARLARPAKRNAFDVAMLRQLSEAYTRYEEDPDARCMVLVCEGAHFTAGLDLAEVGPQVASGALLFPEGLVDPLGLQGRRRTKPVLAAVRGWCLTIGIELMLAADIRLAADDTRFGQIEINRGIFPFGGATLRFPQIAGWGDAMRWLLTGDMFDAAEARRIGLVQEVTTPDELETRALSLADTVARRAPLGVQATLASARAAIEDSFEASVAALQPQIESLMDTDDAAEGVRSFVERRDAKFHGR
ncbi:MAG: crotonase/enoyl-CoA hydratase family protein [Nannocystaceae bacterium]